MHGTYLRILEKIDYQRPAMRTLAKRALLWVMAAGRPLTLEELGKAVAIEPTTKHYTELKLFEGQTVVNACGNFLTVDPNKLVRTVHYTVQEFLRASTSLVGIETPSLLQKYQIFMEDAHFELAQYCVQFMLFPEFHYYFSPGEPVLSGYIVEFWDYHMLVYKQPHNRLHDTFRKCFTDGMTNIQCAYNARYAVFRSGTSALQFCASFGLLHIYGEIEQFDLSKLRSVYKYALHDTAKGREVSSVQTLLDLGFSVHDRDGEGVEPLYHAAEKGRGSVVEFLLANGAMVNSEGGWYGNALQAATIGGHTQVVQLLLDTGAMVNAEGGIYGSSLQAAAHCGCGELVELLIKNGADTNAQGGEYGSPLRAATDRGRNDIVELLLRSGARSITDETRYDYFLPADLTILTCWHVVR